MEALVLSGGSAKGFGMLGILHRLSIEKEINLERIKIFVGSSIGGVIVAMLCFDFSPIEIFFFFLDALPFSYTTNREKVLERLKDVFKDYTFRTLYEKTNKILVLTSFDKKNHYSIYYSKETYPNKKIIDAVSETSNVPFTNTNDIYIDGCLCSPFPIKYTKETFGDINILGIYTFSTNSTLLPIPNLYDDLKIVLSQLYNKVILYETFFSSKDDLLIRFDNNVPFETFSVDWNLSRQLFMEGYLQATK